MQGVQSMGTASFDTFDTEYQKFNKAFYGANPQFGVTNVDVKLELVSKSSSRRRLGERQLQGQGLTVVYNQAIAYSIAEGSGLQPADVVTQPFATQSTRDAFASMLKDSGDAAFANIQSVSGVSQSQPASAGGDGGLSTAAIIGIAVGGAAGAVLLLGGGFWLIKRNSGGGYAKDIDDQPPSSLNLGGGDDVSTLQDPTRSDNRVSGYGDQR